MEKNQTETETNLKNHKESFGIESDADQCPSKYRGWKAMPFIIGNEIFEKVGIIGSVSNLLIYLTTVFNMKSITAATIINVFSGTTNFGTFIAAFLCDSYFGRYKTLGFSIIICFLGSLLVVLTSLIKDLHPPSCGTELKTICKGPTTAQFSFLLLGLFFLVAGAGGIRPCNLPFGADQFNPNSEAGKKGLNSFFNWYFFTYTSAQILSVTLIVYIQSSVSWSIGLAIPAVLMFLGIIIFYLGSNIYVKVNPSGSPMLSIVQVIVVSIEKRGLKLVNQPVASLYKYTPVKTMNSKLGYTNQFRCLDKAAIMTTEDRLNSDGSPLNPWKLCSMQQVEEVKCLLRVMPIWIAASLYYIAYIQQMTYVTFQALQSDRRISTTGTFQIPAASYFVFNMLAMSTFIPFYDRILVPYLRKKTGKEGGLTLLQRIGIGMFMSVFYMIISGFVEDRRRAIALTKPVLGIAARRGGISSMSGLWLIPQLMLSGVGEALTAIGIVEFYYKQFPENMRSIAGSLYYCGLGAASYFNTFLISTVHRTTELSSTGNWLSEDLNKGRLDYFYFLIAGLMALNFGYFLMCSKWYKYKGVDDYETNGDSEQVENKLLV